MTEDALVVGGGPAGAMAALHLARAGRSPLLFEREAEPRHRICGEFVSVEAAALLRDAGLDMEALGAAPIDRLRLVHGRQVAETPLPFAAFGLSRIAMDAALLDAAEIAGARVRRGVAARRIDGLSVDTGDGAVEAGALVLASGKHEVRGAPRDTAGTMDDLVGFKMHWRLAPGESGALDRHIEIALFDGGYAGLQMIEGGVANLCLLVSRRAFAAAGKRWDSLLSRIAERTPHLGDRLSGATALFDRPLTISGVPYGFRHQPAADDPSRLYRVGDQMAVIPSFSGDGMAIAMHSGRDAAAAVVAGTDARDWHRDERLRMRSQLRLANGLHRIGRSATMQAAIVRATRAWPGLARQAALRTRFAV